MENEKYQKYQKYHANFKCQYCHYCQFRDKLTKLTKVTAHFTIMERYEQTDTHRFGILTVGIIVPQVEGKMQDEILPQVGAQIQGQATRR